MTACSLSWAKGRHFTLHAVTRIECLGRQIENKIGLREA